MKKFKLNKGVLFALIGAMLLIPITAFAVEDEAQTLPIWAKYKVAKHLKLDPNKNEMRQERINKLFDTYLPEDVETLNALREEHRSIHEEINGLREDIKGFIKEQREGFEGERRENFKEVLQGLKSDVEEGKYTREEAREILLGKRQDIKNQWQIRKSEIKEMAKEKISDIRELRKEKRLELKEALENQDENKIKEILNEYLDRFKEHVEKDKSCLNKMKEQLQL